MANAEDSEPLLGHNGSSIWTVSPRSKGETSGMETQGGSEKPEIAENLSTPQLHYGTSGMMSPENSELLASLSSPHLQPADLQLQAVSGAQPPISSARLPHADTQINGHASQAKETSSQEMRPATAPGQVNMPEAKPAPSALVWPAETLAQISGQGQNGKMEGAPLGMHLSTISSAASQESGQGESELSRDDDDDDDDEDEDEEEEDEEEEEEEEGEEGDQQSAVHVPPVGRPKNLMANLLPGAQFSMPRMSQDDVPELLRSITPQQGVHFLPGLGGSHGSGRTSQAPTPLESSHSIGSKPPTAGLRWSSSIVSSASTDAGGISLVAEAPSMTVDDDTPIVNIRLQLKKGGREHYVSPSQMPQIAVDEELWLGSSSYVTELPPAMQNFRFLKTNWTDMHSSNHAYLDIKFHEQSKVYVLMHSLLPVPDWLRERFEPDEHMTVRVDWKLDMIQHAIAYFGLKYDEMKKSRIKVWKLKEGFVAGGTRLKFPGLGAKHLLQLGFNYVVCWNSNLDDSVFLNGTKTRTSEKYSSKEQLNAALQEAIVMQDVIKADALLKQDADVNMTLAMSEYKGCLLTKVPAMAQNMPMLCCLVTHGAELDYHGLKYVLEYGHLLPVTHAPIEAFLCKYVRTTRNPANTCYAIAQALSVAAKEHTSKATEYIALSEKFRRAAINLVEDLNKLSYIGGKERWMLRPDEVLEPTKTYSDHFPVNLASCSSTALKMHDTDYSATSTVQNFIQRAWVGVQFIQVARQAKEPQVHSSGITSNTYFLTLLTHYGFVGPLNRSLLIPVSQVAHVSLFSGRPFFDSPRGRWTYKILCHAIFLIVFHSALFEPKPSERTNPKTAHQLEPGFSAWIPNASNARESYDSNAYTNLIALLLITIGMVVDLANVCIYQYGGSFVKFLSVESFSTKMDLMQLVMLLASTTLWGVMEVMCASTENTYSGTCKYGLQKESLNALKIMFSISAIVVWLQTLFILRPINKGLAPLLYVIGQMTKEVFVFLVPLSALLIGFAVALFSLFWGEIHEALGWTSIWSVVLLLFRFFVSDFQMSLDIFNPEKYDAEFEVDPVLQIYGVAVLIFFIILASILMANLLIAILTYKYDPETIDAESNFQRVMIVDDYQNQVDNNLVSSPFSLVVGASKLLCLPEGMSSKLKPEQFYRFLLPPLDDMSDGRLRPTGAKELPHFLFLITMMPVINALLAALLILAAPLCLAQFSLKTSKFLTRKLINSLSSVITRRPAAGLPSGITFFNRTTISGSSAFGNSVSHVHNRLSAPPPRRNKMLKYMLSVVMRLCLLPFTASLGGVFYFVLLALLVLYISYVWVAALCYSAFWCLHGLFRGLMRSFHASDGNSSQEEEIGETTKKSPSNVHAGPSGKKKWGKLLAKQRKEEFKKIAFRSEEIDTALLLAGITVPEAAPEEQDSKNNSSWKKKPSDQAEKADALEVEKGLLNASIAQGKARMLADENHGRSGAPAMTASMVKNKLNMSSSGQQGMLSSIRQTGQQQQGGLARGIARYDSRLHERGGRSNQPKPFAMNRVASRVAGNPGSGGGLLEASGLMNEMGGVRDDLAAMRDMMEAMAKQMNEMQEQMTARSMAGSENDEEASGDFLLETTENSAATVTSAAH